MYDRKLFKWPCFCFCFRMTCAINQEQVKLFIVFLGEFRWDSLFGMDVKVWKRPWAIFTWRKKTSNLISNFHLMASIQIQMNSISRGNMANVDKTQKNTFRTFDSKIYSRTSLPTGRNFPIQPQIYILMQMVCFG